MLDLTAVFCCLLTASAQNPRSFELQALSPKFWNIVDHQAKLETVATGFGFTEGPMWDAAGFLYVSDETINKIFRVYPNGKKEEVIALGDPDGNTFDREHRLIDCASVLRAIIEVTPDGKYKILADHYDGKKFNSPNDVIVGPDGALYFTDPTLDLVAGEKQEIPFQGVYRLDDKGNVRLLTKDLTPAERIGFFSGRQALLHRRQRAKKHSRVRRRLGRHTKQRPHFRRGAGSKERWRSRRHQGRQRSAISLLLDPRASGSGMHKAITWERLPCPNSLQT